MKHYLVCDGQGFILRKGLCKDQDFAAQAKSGEFVFEGFGNELRDKVDLNTGLVLKDAIPIPVVPLAPPPKPTPYEQLDAITDFLAQDPKAKQHAKLKAILQRLGK